jgi:putative endonuclease
MASRRNGTLYIGVTSDLAGRVYQHREGLVAGFSRRYDCKLLVWYQAFDDLDAARHRELQMKEWKRAWKLRVIEEMNPQWQDLYGACSEPPFPGEAGVQPQRASGHRPSP